MTESIVLGRNTQTQSAISVTQEHLESGTYVLGVQGVGKSSLLLDILLQQLSQGESVIALDPHGDLVRDVIARMPAARLPDTYLLDLKEARKWPFGLNIFALPPDKVQSPEARDSVRNQVMHAFEKLWPETRTGLYFGNVLRPVISTLIENQELTLAHVPRLFYHDPFREHYTKQLRNLEAQDFWGEYAVWTHSKRERYVDPLLDRIKKLLSDDVIRFILCQKQSKLDLAEVLKQRKNILLRLPLRDPAYEYAAPIIGTFFMTLLQAAIFSFGNLPQARRPACTLVIDEFQNFVTEDNERFFSEGRKYKVKQVLAHQYMSQLDRDGLTTMKAAATSAATIVTFRTNKDDSSAMGSLFTGLQRKPTDIYIDVLPHLEDARNPALLKEFYRNTVRPLQLAAKLHEDRKTGEVPSYDFGFGVATFEPSLVTATINHLNDVLYYAQKDGYTNERLLQAFWNDFLLLNKDVAYVEVEDSENMRKIRELERQIQALESIEKRGRQPTVDQTRESTQKAIALAVRMEQHAIEMQYADDESYSSLEQKVADYLKDFPFWIPKKVEAIQQRLEAIERQLKALRRQTDNQYKKLLEKYHMSEHAWRSVALEYGIGDYIRGLGSQRRFQVPQYFESDDNGGIALVFAESKEYTRLSQEQRLLDTVSSSYGYQDQSNREQAHIAKRDLEEAKSKIPPTRKVENSRIREYKKLVQRVIELLIEHPLTADSASFSSAEIANTLQQQPNRQAYVKIASSVFQMNTRDLALCFTPVSWQEADERRNTILAQTRRTYCRGRATVEQEIAAVYQVDLSGQKETKEPEKPSLKKEAPPQVLPGTDTAPSIATGTVVATGFIWKGEKWKGETMVNLPPPQDAKDTHARTVKKTPGKKPTHEDIFDKLDANEPTE